jgi:hypothetical protein
MKSTPAARTVWREAMMTPLVYVGIILLSIYIALIGQGYIVVLAYIVGGIAFFSLQRHFHTYYSETVKDDEVDSDSGDDYLRFPPA